MTIKLKLYEDMKRELLARKAPLVRERDQLLAAKTRINEIDKALDVIDDEIAEYDAAIAPLLPPSQDKQLPDATPADAVVRN